MDASLCHNFIYLVLSPGKKQMRAPDKKKLQKKLQTRTEGTRPLRDNFSVSECPFPLSKGKSHLLYESRNSQDFQVTALLITSSSAAISRCFTSLLNVVSSVHKNRSAWCFLVCNSKAILCAITYMRTENETTFIVPIQMQIYTSFPNK